MRTTGTHSAQPEESTAETVQLDRIPPWSWLAPCLGWALLVLQFSGLAGNAAVPLLLTAVVLLGGSVFSAVHHAEVIALKVGEPFGSIVLALSVTIIEVALIFSLMLSGGEGTETLARDTVFATVMIVLNGIVGLALVIGGARHAEQAFRVQGASAALSVLGTVAVISLVLPNYTLEVAGPFYAPIQLGIIGALSIALYGIFLFVQTIRHRDYFLVSTDVAPVHALPTTRTALKSLGLLLVALIAVVLLAKMLAYPLETAVLGAGLPISLVGVVIAIVVLLPEGIAAVRAAGANQLQTSLTLALGSAIATISLTIPIVAFAAIALQRPLALGLNPEETVLLTLSLFISTITLATGRSTILQGAVHLVIFAVFILLSVRP